MDPSSRLHLLRHAKSDRGDPSLSDRERPLAPRGRRAAELLHRHFAAVALDVDLVLCSPAERTRETWAAVAAGLHRAPEVRFEPQVYDATALELLAVIHTVSPAVTSLMIVGHNPGTEDLINYLTAGGEADAIDRLRAGVPTAAFASLTVLTPWSTLGQADGYLDHFVRPRDLTDE